MGHDIYCYKRPYRDADKREEVYQRLVEPVRDDRDEWLNKFEEYNKETQVSYFRASMGYRRYGRELLYSVLGEKAQKHNAGVSGDGGEEIFGCEELLLARWLVSKADPVGDYTFEEEMRFLNECVAYAEQDPRREVLIYFG